MNLKELAAKRSKQGLTWEFSTLNKAVIPDILSGRYGKSVVEIKKLITKERFLIDETDSKITQYIVWKKQGKL